MSTILVIEDDDIVRRTVKRMVNRGGYNLLEATNGEEGIGKAEEALPDLILCDITMPKLDGYGTLERLQQNPETASIPFIFMTGLGDMQDIRRGMSGGADDYITKPFTREELLEAIRIRLEKRALIERASQEKMEELRGRIMYVLPHELRTPLSAVLGLAELLATDSDSMERERIGTIAKGLWDAGERLSRIIENYLIYSQIEIIASDIKRLQDANKSVVENPLDLIRGVATKTAAEKERQDDLLLNLQSKTSVRISNENLTRVVQELVDNAFKFSSPGDTVTVRCSDDEDFFVFEVRDHGRGMTADEIRRVGAYSQFQRDLYEQPGTGLGLIIAKRLAELHEGILQIESDPNQCVTAVRVNLKKANAAENAK